MDYSAFSPCLSCHGTSRSCDLIDWGGDLCLTLKILFEVCLWGRRLFPIDSCVPMDFIQVVTMEVRGGQVSCF